MLSPDDPQIADRCRDVFRQQTTVGWWKLWDITYSSGSVAKVQFSCEIVLFQALLQSQSIPKHGTVQILLSKKNILICWWSNIKQTAQNSSWSKRFASNEGFCSNPFIKQPDVMQLQMHQESLGSAISRVQHLRCEIAMFPRSSEGVSLLADLQSTVQNSLCEIGFY